jgi:hypothetical protein
LSKYDELSRSFRKVLERGHNFDLEEQIDSTFYECLEHLGKNGFLFEHEVYLTSCKRRADFLKAWEVYGSGSAPTTGFHHGLLFPDRSRLFRSQIFIDVETILHAKNAVVENLVITLMEKRKGYSMTESYLQRKIPDEYKEASYRRARKP